MQRYGYYTVLYMTVVTSYTVEGVYDEGDKSHEFLKYAKRILFSERKCLRVVTYLPPSRLETVK